jgi:hypothetical protein
MNTIVAFSISGLGVACDGGEPTLMCCDVYGNEDGDWVGCLEGQLGVDGNIGEDPLLCDLGIPFLGVHEESPCAPFSRPNPECDLIGAGEVCQAPATVSTSWGQIKARYRDVTR